MTKLEQRGLLRVHKEIFRERTCQVDHRNYIRFVGGGAEAHARFKQYEYRANSSLVLTSENRPRDTHEPTGEPETLWGKIDPKSFGDRVAKGRPQELDDKLKKSKKKERDVVADDTVSARQSKRRRLREESVLTDTDDVVYQPKTKETRAAYEAMLSLIQQQLGGLPLNVVSGAADEILAVLKNDAVKNSDKKAEIQKLLNPAPDQIHQVFDQLVSIGKLITDFQEGGDSGGGKANVDEGLDDDDVGVAVEFEDNEEDGEESDPDMVQEEDDEEDDEPQKTGGMQVDAGIDEEDAGDVNEGTSLNVLDIDAYWLQRKISQAYEQQIDPQQCEVLAEELLKILAEGDDRDVAYASSDQEERNRIEEEMRGLGLELAAIVDQLHSTRATAKEREENVQKSINEEARRLKEETVGDGGRGRRDVTDRDSESGWLKGQRQMLDLESLAFDQGGLLMANKKCDLPAGSYRTHGKGYEEVHVPWVSKKVDISEKLVKITEMPDWAQPAFKGMQQLNRVQSKVFDTALFKADNILLCAPTGAGKTNVAMLTILQQIESSRNEDGTLNHGKYKIVYVAPMKALVAEVVSNLSNRLKDYGVTVRELSGDQSLSGKEIEETQIIVTTPEKWDIITRKSGDRTYTQLVRLLIIDEIHLLHDNRGPVLESIVARTLRQIETTKENIRLVGLSATLPNYEDVALFLRVDLKKGLFKFDRSYRPVPLGQQYIGISVKKPLQRFQLMNDLCYEKVLAGAGKQQSQIDLIKNVDLKNLLPYGFAIHHAGLTRGDREIVEALFGEGHVQVLVSTATLAWGVNLPAHTVIIKGTQVYNPEKGAWMELSPLDVMQMLGRAGRPQYDEYGEGIIITGYSELQYYLSLMNEQLPIESQFISKLADQLNAEIVLGTVQNAKEACHWLGYTYLYIRMVRNPTLYGLAPDALVIDVVLEERRADLSAGRLVRALYEIVLKRGWAQLAEKALNLSKMVGKRMWSVQTPLRQFHGIPNEILMKLEKKDLVWERYYDLSSQELGELIRSPKMGRPLHKFIHQFPKLVLAAQVQPITRTVLRVELTITPDFQWDEKIHKYVEPFWIIVEDSDCEKILHHEYFLLKKQYISEDHTLNFTVPIFEPLPPQYFVRVVSDKWLGSQTVLPVSFRHLILPEKYPPPTELLDLQPLPVTALRNPSYVRLYQDFKHFNPVQTQVFNVLYNTNDNVLVAAPTGSGKTICAEFAILKNHQEVLLRQQDDTKRQSGPDTTTMRVVYIAPLEAITKEQFRIWERKFGKGLGLRVVELTGETALDLKLLEKSQIVISTPEKWDALSRRWKQRKYVQQVSLFIVDELHLIGEGQGGTVLEVIVSRMRYISSQGENKIRIVALSTSLANAKDLGEWIGASSHGLFNFPPGVPPVPLEIHIQGVDISSFEARMQAMTKPTYTAIVQHAKNKKPAIVFVPTRTHVRLTAVDLMAYSHIDNPQSPDFLLGKLEELEDFVDKLREETLKETLRHGIGYLHEGLCSQDQEIVTQAVKIRRS
uniref:RNA helicase n=1 Tax=Brassica oleracea var. oleracea TaxID=109376 RepID=A0A0D3AM67_BRAOL